MKKLNQYVHMNINQVSSIFIFQRSVTLGTIIGNDH